MPESAVTRLAGPRTLVSWCRAYTAASYIGPPPGIRKYQLGSIGVPPGAALRASASSSSWKRPSDVPQTAHARSPIAPSPISSRILVT